MHLSIKRGLAAAGVLATVAAVPAVGAGAPRASAVASRTHTVEFGEYFYRPAKIRITAGDSVRFVNVGKIQHTVADSTRSGTIRSRIIHPRPLRRGASQTVRLRRRGTVHYLCTFHPTMRGMIVVR